MSTCSPTTEVAFRLVRLFDGVDWKGPVDVLVAGGVVTAVAGGVANSCSGVVVDHPGAALLPGLLDAHVHAFPGSLHAAARFGVTTVVDMFNTPDRVAQLRRAAVDDPSAADIISAGIGATAPGGHPTALVERGFLAPFPTVVGPAQADGFVAARQTEGSQFLKIIVEDGGVVGRHVPHLDLPTVAALVRAAHRAGLVAVAHATTQQAARDAVRAGVDGITHLPIDAPVDTATVAALATRGGFAIPTLTAMESLCGGDGGAHLARHPAVSSRLEPWRLSVLSATVPLPHTGCRFEHAMTGARRLHAAGVRLLAGTDASNLGTAHGASLHRELQLLTCAGLTPTEALRSATSTVADTFGLVDRGRVAVGQRADLTLVDGDPGRRMSETLELVGVWRSGVSLYPTMPPVG